MKILGYSLICTLLFCWASCKKNEGVFISTDVEISVVNSQGQDLLNSLYTKDNIIVSRLVNGQNLPYTKEVIIRKENLHVLRLFASNTNEPNITLIQFGLLKPDTIRCEFLKSEGSIYCSKVWFNENLKFDDSKQTNLIERRFTIIK